MSTVTDTITVTLVQAVGGLLAEVENLPMQVGVRYDREHRLAELAVSAVQQHHPELLPLSYSIEAEDRVIVWVERL